MVELMIAEWHTFQRQMDRRNVFRDMQVCLDAGKP